MTFFVEGPKMPKIIRITIENKNKFLFHPFKGEHLFWENYNLKFSKFTKLDLICVGSFLEKAIF